MVPKKLLLITLLAGSAYADTGYSSTIRVKETDNSPACTIGELNVSPGTLTCAGQKATITTGGGGSGGSSTMEVAESGVQKTSPTASMNFFGGDFDISAAAGNTALIRLSPGTTNYIWNSSSLQSGATAYPDFLYVGSSATILGANGLKVTYGAVAGSMTVSNLTSGQCVQTGTGGLLTVTGSACGAGSGSGIVSPGTFTWVNNFGIQGSTLNFTAFNTTTTSATVTGSAGLLVLSTVTIQPPTASNDILVASVTLPSTLSAATQGVFIDVIGAGSSNVNVGALRVSLDSGFTGNGTVTQNAAIFATNASSIAATITNRTSAGIVGQATGLGTGTQIGVIGNSAQASGTNIGMNGKAINATNSPVTNMGVYGMAGNGVTNNIAGYFALATNHNLPGTLGNSALIADNGAIASNIFEARDNGTSQFTIADGGGVTASAPAGVSVTYGITAGTITTPSFNTSATSVTVAGAAGLNVLYGATSGSMTVSNLTSGQCVQAGAGGLLTVSGAACGSGSGSGYALEPATVTIQANKGITASTGTFYTTTSSTEAFIIKDTAGISAFRFNNTTLVSTDTIFTVIGSTGAFGVVGFSTSSAGPFSLSVSSTNHVNTKTPSPTLSSCGSSPSVLGSDFAFTITGGATSNGCTATFAIPFVAVPTCSVSQQTMSLVNALSYTVSATALTVTQTGLGTGKIDVVCIGHD